MRASLAWRRVVCVVGVDRRGVSLTISISTPSPNGRERAKAEGALEEAISKVAELEDQLDKAGGDAAARRQAMRSLEAATQELGEEVRARGVDGGLSGVISISELDFHI